MSDYTKMYYTLFNAMSESTEKMLIAMQEAEKIYIESVQPPISLAEPENPSPAQGAPRTARR